MSEVVMPRLSDTMEEGELAKWLKNEGDVITKGDILAEIETDKATMDLEAFESGVLEKHLVEAGTVVPIGTPVAMIGDGSGKNDAPKKAAPKGKGAKAGVASADAAKADDASGGAVSDDDASADDVSDDAVKDDAPAKSEPVDAEEAEETEAAAPEEAAPEAAAPEEAATEDAAPETSGSAAATPESQSPDDAAPAEFAPDDSDRPRMSPLARKIAKDHGLDPANIAGSGPQGRVVRADVEAAIAGGSESGTPASDAASTSTAPSGTPSSGPASSGLLGTLVAAEPAGEDEVVAINRIRKVTAKRLTESQTIPHFFLTSVVSVGKLLDFRTELNETLESQGIKVSVNDLFVRAAAVALRQHPEANSSWGDDSLIRRASVNVGIAVATDSGLLVPVVREADRKDLGTISRETVALAKKARDGKLSPDEMSGGTFSVSNLGMFGIDQFTAMINPPEAAILAVGATSMVPMLRDGQLVEVPQLKITLTVDHRVMDGAVAAGFLRDLVNNLEKPLRLIL